MKTKPCEICKHPAGSHSIMCPAALIPIEVGIVEAKERKLDGDWRIKYRKNGDMIIYKQKKKKNAKT